MKQLLLLVVFFYSIAASAQVAIGTSTPDVHSLLELKSTTKGLLAPRLTPTERSTLGSSLSTNETGMIILDSATGKPYIWNGTTFKDYTTYTGTTPITVNATTNTIALNSGTNSGDLLSWNGDNWVNISGNTYVKPTASNMQPYLTLNYCISAFGIYPSQGGEYPFVGEIELFAFNFPPNGWFECNGQLLSITNYSTLFNLIGTYYGGNATTNFALPNLQGRVPIHQGNGFNIGDQGGSQTVPAY